jgi:hypothetical protein
MAGGLRSGRERKAHTPFAGADEPRGKGLTFEVRSRRSQPTTFVSARYVAPALTAVRNLRLVNLVPTAKLYTFRFLRERQTYRTIGC